MPLPALTQEEIKKQRLMVENLGKTLWLHLREQRRMRAIIKLFTVLFLVVFQSMSQKAYTRSSNVVPQKLGGHWCTYAHQKCRALYLQENSGQVKWSILAESYQ